MKLLPPDESNSVYNIIKAFQLSLHTHRTNIAEQLQNKQELLSFCSSIFKTESKAHTFLYFCEHEAATAHILQVQLGIPESTVYNVLRDFSRMGVIYRLRRLPSQRGFLLRGGGPRPIIYGLYGTPAERVAECINLHYRSLSPKYLVAEEIAQSILDIYLKKRNINEISLLDIRKEVKAFRKPFVLADLSTMVADILREKGVKVWR